MSNGIRLNSGLDTISTFNLATNVPMQFSESVRVRFSASSSSANDYLSNYNHISQFSTNSQEILADGSNYNNNFVPRYSQFIAPVDCYLKSINGFINTLNGASCSREEITISVWSKPTTVGTSSTPISLLFTQDFVFTSSSNSNALAIDGSTDSKVGNQLYKILAKEGVLVSIKRETSACSHIQAAFTMIFETIDNQSTLEEFNLNTISVANNRFDGTISNPNKFNLPK